MKQTITKGFALIWSLILITILLIVSTTVATAIVKESRMSLNSTDSLRAYSAAQTGVDLARTQFVNGIENWRKTNGNTDDVSYDFNGLLAGNNASYSVKYWPSPKSLIESTGTVGTISRKIDYTMAAPTEVTPNSDLNDAINGQNNKQLVADKSFSLSFDYWAPTSGSTNYIRIQNSNGYINIGLTVFSQSVNVVLYEHINSTGTNVPTPVADTISSFNAPLNTFSNTPYSYNIKVDYEYDAYLKYTFTTKDSNMNPKCAKTNVYDVSAAPALDLSGNDSLVFSPAVSLYTPTSSDNFTKPVFTSGGIYMDNFIGVGIGVSTPRQILTISNPIVGGTVSTADNYINCGTGGNSCQNNFVKGAAVTLTAVADTGYSFGSWSGGTCSGTDSQPCTFTINSDITVGASFTTGSQSNLITNGDFSNGFTSWSVVNFSGPSWQLGNESGNNYISITHTAGTNWSAIGQDMTSKMSSNTNYQLTFRYKAAVGTTGSANFRLGDSTMEYVTTILGGFPVTADGAWHSAEIDFTTTTFPPVSGRSMPMLGIWFDYNQLGTYYFDDLSLVAGTPSGGGGSGTSPVILTSGSGSWTAPAGVTSVTVYAWGAGGSNEGNHGYDQGGGGGGAFTKSVMSVVPGNTYNYSVGMASTGNAGGDTWFVNASTVLARGGGYAGDSGGAAGGQASGCIPSAGAYSGGNGGYADTSDDWGGGGGGGAGSGGAGGRGYAGGDAGGSGGAGGTGTYSGGSGSDGSNYSDASAPGGGGGGDDAYGDMGGNGANGQIILVF